MQSEVQGVIKMGTEIVDDQVVVACMEAIDLEGGLHRGEQIVTRRRKILKGDTSKEDSLRQREIAANDS